MFVTVVVDEGEGRLLPSGLSRPPVRQCDVIVVPPNDYLVMHSLWDADVSPQYLCLAQR